MSLASSKIAILQDRAAMFKAVRTFFEERHVLEVDTPMLSPAAPIDAYIDILETQALPHQKGYLHSSPEYGMKKLLAQGFSDIFQLSHVYRQGELSAKHQIEFTMLEWYRHQFSLRKLMEETQGVISLFLGEMPSECLRYDRVFKAAFSIDPIHSSLETLQTLCHSLGLHSASAERDVYLSFLWDHIEPSLGEGKLTYITHFPGSQAALSKIFVEEGVPYAGRFECYYQGMELANGYHELTDPVEQRKRFLEQNRKRVSIGKPSLPIDEEFLSALEHLKNHENLFGVAVGFDRLMMLRHHTSEICDILPLSFSTPILAQ